jgi:LmbE family N-acetylglucosaminyl deacetylase
VTALLLAPHNDDETLFAGFSVQRFSPHVVTCFQSWAQEQRGGPSHSVRQEETIRACWNLGATDWEQWLVRDDAPDAEMLAALLIEIRDRQGWDMVLAPAFEDGGHEQHNLVAEMALGVFGEHRLVTYLTYVRGSGKTRSDTEVPFDAMMVSKKMRAMSCYRSQIAVENTRYWFCDETLREWYA